MAEDMIRGLATEQRKRFIASMLNAAESTPWWGRLNPAEKSAYRDKVLACVGVYHDFMLDVLKVSSEGSMRNELAVGLIQQVHDSQRRLERSLSITSVPVEAEVPAGAP